VLSAQDNELLTRVGPGTPMGRLMREYWVPALLSTELASPDCAPVRVMLLGERLIAFRDSEGRPGLVAEACPHRGASLYFARNAKCGLRCAYHGWKFDVSGACLDTPTEPAGSRLKHRVRARAYACVERGGIVWAYLGSRATPPSLPELESNLDPHQGPVDACLVPSNWLQNLEGDIDVTHIPYLHTDNLDPFAKVLGMAPRASAGSEVGEETPAAEIPAAEIPEPSFPAPHIEVADTPAGFAFAARVPTPAGPGEDEWWTVGHFMFPFYANLPYGGLGSYWVVARVPMDDYHTMTFALWKRGAPRTDSALMFGAPPSFLPNSADWFDRFRLTRGPDNDFKLDRELARLGGTGISGQAVQDAAITASMGLIVDRTGEHLGRADIAVSHLRRRLLTAINAIDSAGAPAVDDPSAYRVLHGAMRLRRGGSWYQELHRRGGAGPIGRTQSVG
jgi:phthalate 4,5-dioxygenase oxygenase subunit